MLVFGKDKQYWLDKRKNTPFKVIGWTSTNSFQEFSPADPNFDDYFAAAINDIAEHHWLFPGDNVIRLPVFNDFRTFRPLPAKMIGLLMALANDIYDEYGYSLFTWYERMEDDCRDDDIKYPPEGPYNKERVTLTVENKVYREMYKNLVRFNDTRGKKPYTSCLYFLFVSRAIDPLWSNENYIIQNENGLDSFEMYPSFIIPAKDYQEYEEIKTDLLEIYQNRLVSPILVEDEKRTKKMLENDSGFVIVFVAGDNLESDDYLDDDDSY